MKTRTVLLVLASIAAAVALVLACGPGGFTPEQQIASVRVLASRAENDAIYAQPGETVTLQTLVVDGRLVKTPAMQLYWIPVVCENPASDEYYECFAPSGDGGSSGRGGIVNGVIDAGAPLGDDAGTSDAAASDAAAVGDATTSDASVNDGSAEAGEAGSDAGVGSDDAGTSAPSPSPTLTFTVPMDVISQHPVVQGAPAPYGLMIDFNVACAGHLQITSVNPAAGPQQVPIACVDDAGNPLGPDDYVISFTRVYVYESVRNHNPEIDGLVLNGAETKTFVAGTALPNALAITVPACGVSCPAITLDVDVPLSSWEVDPLTKDSSGNSLHESLWVDYYVLNGNLDSSARLLYDTTAGQITGKGSTVNYTPPSSGGDTLWAVVHDNRDGVNWLQVNITTQ